MFMRFRGLTSVIILLVLSACAKAPVRSDMKVLPDANWHEASTLNHELALAYAKAGYPKLSREKANLARDEQK